MLLMHHSLLIHSFLHPTHPTSDSSHTQPTPHPPLSGQPGNLSEHLAHPGCVALHVPEVARCQVHAVAAQEFGGVEVGLQCVSQVVQLGKGLWGAAGMREGGDITQG